MRGGGVNLSNSFEGNIFQGILPLVANLLSGAKQVIRA